ncbi:MAG: bifunctional phosphoribosyl-AMP cyclohydrolase/phosphoribosyl-ATP diphosphatase HisIE [Euryarchaeota archaeon]|nr:bifunctional phosphoribosyl-AMP cyclohydrolase/phosphoribosyl-ATP diphosphatase HisIE [Euryarchaeota archaeon]MDE1836754.1 bifunctional phosphoribosyl-AMP cyclohydrolase/phosphoribosyl-ATP diphosphatase HisIE [Euryarchaeota archaeon]MDE1879772.1 bifunctional phosphoribosyl-AMP cyclohydrolase/phosphoribosyl-ATP diphosphatase HisIE [Euryarchaeota archaeon]MDE2044738.1 bifunctional phosphoribosyl-AMP cyclohydrolase/phosphoribosyl-ATP diphosphatase HisIE [Thermoplasmata archaeon]
MTDRAPKIEGRASRPDFQDGTLLPTVVQDVRDGTVLMVAYSRADSWREMLRTGKLTLFSRSRARIWTKGESSGNTAKVVAVGVDCDRDALLVKVLPRGPMCHTGTRSCFGETLPLEDLQVAPQVRRLEELINTRRRKASRGSYTRKLLRDETMRLKKVGEEASELLVAAAQRDRRQVVWEAADLLYHTTVLLRAAGVGWDQVHDELSRRARPSSRRQRVPPRSRAGGRRA